MYGYFETTIIIHNVLYTLIFVKKWLYFLLVQARWFLRSPHHSPIFSFFVFLASHSLYVVANGINKINKYQYSSLLYG